MSQYPCCRIAKKFVELDVSVDPEELDLLIEKLSPIGPFIIFVMF